MHIQIINFQLKGLGRGEYDNLCEQLAPTWAGIPGLISKVWLENDATNTYGGVYTWRDKSDMDNFVKSELFKAVATNPNFDAVTSRDFAVSEGPTRVTRGLRAVGVTE
jgi:heme-degrading monooxygenase HmoA